MAVAVYLQAELLQDFCGAEEDSTLISEMKQNMGRELEHQYVNIQRVQSYDPRFKKQLFRKEERNAGTFRFCVCL